MQVVYIGVSILKNIQLTKGKIYDAELPKESQQSNISIKCDDDIERWFSMRYFISLDEFRNNKIDELCK